MLPSPWSQNREIRFKRRIGSMLAKTQVKFLKLRKYLQPISIGVNLIVEAVLWAKTKQIIHYGENLMIERSIELGEHNIVI